MILVINFVGFFVPVWLLGKRGKSRGKRFIFFLNFNFSFGEILKYLAFFSFQIYVAVFSWRSSGALGILFRLPIFLGIFFFFVLQDF